MDHELPVTNGVRKMFTAKRLEENVSTMQPTTHLYWLSEPLNGHSHVLVSVSTLPHCADDTHVFACTESGAAVPDPVTEGYWVLAHYPDDTSHDSALAELGYEVV